MKKLILAVVAITFSAGLFAQTLQDAQRELDNESYIKAKRILFKLLSSGDVMKQDVYYYLGNTYLNSDDADSAKMFYKLSADIDGKTPMGYVATGHLALLNKNMAEAKLNFDRALQLTKMKNASIYFLIGDAYYRPNVIDLRLAMSNLQSAFDLDNKNISATLELGDAYLDSSDRDQSMGGKAMSKYQYARDLNPKLAMAWIKEGRLDMRGRIYDQAITAFKSALEIDPNYAIVYKDLAEAYYSTKQFDKFYENYKKYVELSPGDTKARTWIIEMYMRNKEYDKAIEEANKGLQHDVNNFNFTRYIFRADFERKSYKEGYDVMTKFWQMPGLKPKTEDYVYSAKLAAQMQDTAGAMKYFQTALAGDSLNCDLLGEYGKVLYLMKRYDAAVAQFSLKKANCDPKKFNYSDLFYLGKSYVAILDSVNADTTFAQYISKYPTALEGYYYRAQTQAQFHLGSDDYGALPYYQKVIELGEKNIAAYKAKVIEGYKFLAIYKWTKEKDTPAAKDYLQKILELDPNDPDAPDMMKEMSKGK